MKEDNHFDCGYQDIDNMELMHDRELDELKGCEEEDDDDDQAGNFDNCIDEATEPAATKLFCTTPIRNYFINQKACY